MNRIYYFINDDMLNPRVLAEIKYLKTLYKKLVVITQHPKFIEFEKLENIHYVHLSKCTSKYILIQKIYGKLIYLFTRNAYSLTDFKFPERNIYSSKKIIRKIINTIWPLKNKLNKYLPRYSKVYIFPYWIIQLIRKKISIKNENKNKRTIIYDSLLTNAYRNIHICYLKKFYNIERIGLVRSWDNPFYAQFDTTRDSYIIWSEYMQKDINKSHKIDINIHSYSGPLILKNYIDNIERSIKTKENIRKQKSNFIGYAGCFPDKEMIQHEVNLITYMNNELRSINSKKIILFRPYPCVDTINYIKLEKLSNVCIEEIKAERVKRNIYDKELIKFDTEMDKLNYFNKLDYFISLGTTFTFEAILSNCKVIQLDIYKIAKEKKHESTQKLSDRIKLSDHIIKYFINELYTINSIRDAVNYESDKYNHKKSKNLLNKIGIKYI